MVYQAAFGMLFSGDKEESYIVIADWSRIICLVIGSISFGAGILVSLSYILSKNLRSHPAFLIVLICICESIATYHMLLGAFNVTAFTKESYLYKLAYYLFFKMDLRSEAGHKILVDRYAELLCESNNMLISAFSLASVMFNTCLCVDLLLTFRRPFSPPQRRNKFFIGVTAFFSIAITYGFRDLLKDPCREFRDTDSFQSRTTPATVFFLLFFVIFGIISIIYTKRRLRQDYNMSRDKKKIFYRKHVLYVLFFIIVWFLSSISNGIFTYCYISAADKSQGNEEIYKQCLEGSPRFVESLFLFLTNLGIISSLCGGTVLGIIRISEPYFLHFLRVYFARKLCCFIKVKKDDAGIKNAEENLSKNNIVSGFMLSALGVELVQNILHAFTDVITAESADIQLKQLTKRDIILLSKSNSIHMLDKVEIDPRLLDTEAVSEVFRPENCEVAGAGEEEDSRNSVDFSEFVKKKNEGEDMVEFIEYAPRLFYQLRKADGVTSETLEEAFNPQKNREAAFNAGESQGKSGSFFFFTHNRKFYIKTMNAAEYTVFMKMLPAYYCRCMKCKDSLIARTYGVFGLRLPGMAPLYFYLMENCLRLDKRDLIAKYDLKGSKVNREVFDEETLEVSYTLKDENFTRRSSKEKFMGLLPQDARRLRHTVERDVEFLRQQKLMDYSLILAITLDRELVAPEFETERYKHPKDPNDPDFKQKLESIRQKYRGNKNVFVSPKGYVYHLGIIDYLQEFDTMKILENRFKRFKYGMKKMEEVSAIEPEPYAARFIRFVKEEILKQVHQATTKE